VDRSIIAESSSSSSHPAEFALVRKEEVAEVLSLPALVEEE
jgi:hypothetical protein